MQHHFGDFLDRDGGYWSIVPNRDRYGYRIDDIPAGSPDVTIVTIGKDDPHWERVLTLPNLEELTLHAPTPDQLVAAGTMRSLKRLRVTHARPKSIEFIGSISELEELVMEYVSGVNDLSPLSTLKHLRALHLENLRRVSDFSGLAGATNLRYLAIYGTTDWEQPIDCFEFLRNLKMLEVLAMWQVKSRSPYPATLPAVSLRRLKSLRLHGSYLPTEEYALLEEALRGVKGAAWGPFKTRATAMLELPGDDFRAQLPVEVIRARHPEVLVSFDGKRMISDPASLRFEFTGRGAGRVKCSSPTAAARCHEQSRRYLTMKERARELVIRTSVG